MLPFSTPVIILNYILARIIYAAIMRLTAPCSIYLTEKKYNKIKYYKCNVNAYQIIINQLRKEISKCDKSKKSDKCKIIVRKQIEKLRAKQQAFVVSMKEEMHKKKYKIGTLV